VDVESLADVLEREHRAIDEGIAAFAAGPAARARDPATLCAAIAGLRRHIYLEEQFLFPPLHEAGLITPIVVMLREHGQIWDALDTLESDLAANNDVLMLCRQLAVRLQHHNLKEEKVIYPHADETLPVQERARLRDQLAVSELPAGWACRQAGARTRRHTGRDRH